MHKFKKINNNIGKEISKRKKEKVIMKKMKKVMLIMLIAVLALFVYKV